MKWRRLKGSAKTKIAHVPGAVHGNSSFINPLSRVTQQLLIEQRDHKVHIKVPS